MISLQEGKPLNNCKQTKAKTNQTIISADMSAESFSPAHCRHFTTIKHFHGIPGGEMDGNGAREGVRNEKMKEKEGKPTTQKSGRGYEMRQDHGRQITKKKNIL